MGNVYGYVRVSSTDQNESRQMITMAKYGIGVKKIFMDKKSGKDFQRPQYQAMLNVLRPGDLVCVASLDRFGRDYDEIKEQWRVITSEKKADIQILDMPLLDTRRGKDLVGTLIADLVLQLLSFVAQNERENIRKRQAEGIAAAKARGVRCGRAPKPLPKKFVESYTLWKTGEKSMTQAAAHCGMPRTTFSSRVKSLENVRH